jgi:ElaB/YqjD/DUF883 family membrane-anchored ribosome-binding protein
MPAKTTTFDDLTSSGESTIGEKVGQVTSQVKDKVSDFGKAAADKIDSNRESAASGLESAASALHDKAEDLPGGERVTSLAHSAADKLTATAGYVREHDVKAMLDDVGELVKKNPGPALLVAAAIGFLIGRAFSSDD